jgi:hypothetical protein
MVKNQSTSQQKPEKEKYFQGADSVATCPKPEEKFPF